MNIDPAVVLSAIGMVAQAFLIFIFYPLKSSVNDLCVNVAKMESKIAVFEKQMTMTESSICHSNGQIVDDLKSCESRITELTERIHYIEIALASHGRNTTQQR